MSRLPDLVQSVVASSGFGFISLIAHRSSLWPRGSRLELDLVVELAVLAQPAQELQLAELAGRVDELGGRVDPAQDDQALDLGGAEPLALELGLRDRLRAANRA